MNSPTSRGAGKNEHESGFRFDHGRRTGIAALSLNQVAVQTGGAVVEYHVDTGADITMAVQPVSAHMAPALGILKRSADGEIVNFAEKPDPTALPNLESLPDPDRPFLASMGIYVFRTDLLFEVLKSSCFDR